MSPKKNMGDFKLTFKKRTIISEEICCCTETYVALCCRGDE
jgi:hypothetical protein